MFDGNRFFPDTGMPMRKIACISSPFALAEPVPLTFASFSAKSLLRTSMAEPFDVADLAAVARGADGGMQSSIVLGLFGCSCSKLSPVACAVARPTRHLRHTARVR